MLDELKSEPSLLPPEEPLRGQVEEAERWGDEVLQMAARRIGLAASMQLEIEGRPAGALVDRILPEPARSRALA